MINIKYYLISSLFLCFTSTSFSQKHNKVNLGFTVSPTLSSLQTKSDGYSDESSIIGVHYGLIIDFRLFGVDNYSLSTGFIANQMGGKLSMPSFYTMPDNIVIPAISKVKYSLTYIDLPLTVRLKTNEIGYNTFYGVFGTEVGFLVNAKEKYTDSYLSTTLPEQSQNITNEINLLRSSLVFGIGVERQISGNTYYRIGLTYHNGLTNIIKGNAYSVDSNGNTLIVNNTPINDNPLDTKLSFLELNLAILL